MSKKIIYLVDGWTNERFETKKIQPYYDFTDKGKGPLKVKWIEYGARLKGEQKVKKVLGKDGYRPYREEANRLLRRIGPFTFRNGKIKPKPPFKIIVAESPITKSSAYFNSLLLYHLNLIEITEENSRSIAWSLVNEPLDHKLDNVDVLLPPYEGIDGLCLKKGVIEDKEWMQHEEWILSNSAKKVLEGRMNYAIPGPYDYFAQERPIPRNFAGVPGHCRFLSGEEALEFLVKTGNKAILDFFRKAVKYYERRTI